MEDILSFIKSENIMSLKIMPFLLFGLQIYAQDPTVGLVYYTEEANDGYTLFSPENNNFVYLINKCGILVNSWEFSDIPNRTAYLQENGNLIRAGIEKIEIRDWNNNVIWNYPTKLLMQHHDIEPLPNGNILVIAYDYYTNAQIREKGKSETFEEDSIRLDKIIEIKPVGKDQIEIVWEWKLFDHLIQDLNPSLENYGNIQEYPGMMNINYSQELNFSHVNSIDYNENLDQILISARNLSEIFIIDHSTTMQESASSIGGNFNSGGDFLWRWGNKNNYLNDSIPSQLYRQHDAKWIIDEYPDGGAITVFDNNPGGDSFIKIVKPEIDEENYVRSNDGFLPLNEEFSWSGQILGDQLKENRKSGFMRLNNGNFLVCETSKGRISEISMMGSVVWSYVNPTGKGNFEQYDSLFGNGTFRAIRYEREFEAFQKFELKLSSVIEDENNISNDCQNDILASKNVINHEFVMNPVYDQQLIFLKQEEFDIKGIVLYDNFGKIRYKQDLSNNPSTVEKINLDSKTGIYHLLIIGGNGGTVYQKLLVK